MEDQDLMQSLRDAKPSGAGMPFPYSERNMPQPFAADGNATTIPPTYDSGTPSGGNDAPPLQAADDPASPGSGPACVIDGWWDSGSGSIVLQRTDGSQIYIQFQNCP